MGIGEFQSVLDMQMLLGRTPRGHTLSDYAKQTLNAVLNDTQNQSANVLECLNCGFIFSELLSNKGCPNCGGQDLDANLNP